jgi:hypothetical protein
VSAATAAWSTQVELELEPAHVVEAGLGEVLLDMLGEVGWSSARRIQRKPRLAREENTVKAAVYHRFGSPDVLELQDIDPAALRYLGEGHARAKVVITV